MGKKTKIFLVIVMVFVGTGVIMGIVVDDEERQVEIDRITAETARIAVEKVAAERLERYNAELERFATEREEKLEAERVATERERLEADRIEAIERAQEREEQIAELDAIFENDRVERIAEEERLESLKTPEQREQERIEAERLYQERVDRINQEREERLDESKNQCIDYTERLDGLPHLIKSLTHLCESVPFGSDSGFYEFSWKMQDLENILREQNIHPKTINVKAWKLFNAIEDDCDHNPGLQTVATLVKNDFAWMGLCFEDMYEEFGEFPAMEIGLSPDYFDYNPRR